MLVDVVLYGGEFELLKARMSYLKADHTVIVEGNRRFQGQFKDWTLYEHLNELPGQWTYLPVESTEFPNPWLNEYNERNEPMSILRGLGLPDDAVIGWFDVDEFPDGDMIRKQSDMAVWRMRKHQGSAYWFQQVELTGLSGPWSKIKDSDMAQLRRSRDRLPKVDGGYHLSSFGEMHETVAKWEGFSHFELRRPDMEQWVAHCWTNGIAIENGKNLTQLDELPEDMPDYFLNNLGPKHWYRRRPDAA